MKIYGNLGINNLIIDNLAKLCALATKIKTTSKQNWRSLFYETAPTFFSEHELLVQIPRENTCKKKGLTTEFEDNKVLHGEKMIILNINQRE